MPLVRPKIPLSLSEPSDDPRNLDYPASEVLKSVADKRKVWKTGATLNQGSSYDCTSFCWTGDLMAAPQGDFKATAAKGNELGHKMGLDLFKLQAGGKYGNAINLGAEWSKQRGYITEYRWPANLDELIQVLIGIGPVCLGTDWYPSMNYPRADDTIRIQLNTSTPSNHAYYAIGYEPEMEFKGVKKPREAVLLKNSWGNWWGRDGAAWVPASDLDRLIRSRPSFGYTGQACFAVGRKPFSVEAALAT